MLRAACRPARCAAILAARRYLSNGPTRASTIGFIGLGAMGQHMANNLVKASFTTNKEAAFIVHDHSTSASETWAQNAKSLFPGRVIQTLQTPAEVAASAQTIFTMLPSSPQVLQVYTSPENGLLAGLARLNEETRRATTLVDCTTLDQAVSLSVNEQVASAGAAMIDAPVSGGAVGAQEATLSFMLGGAQAPKDIARPLLRAMGKNIFDCGLAGAGLAAKIANNLLLGISMCAVSEAFILGQKLGLSPAVLASVINASSGRCWASEINNPVSGALAYAGRTSPADRAYEPGFKLALMAKDLGLAAEAIKKHDLQLSLSEYSYEVYKNLATNEVIASRDFSAIYQVLLGANGGEITVEPGVVDASGTKS
ncbi:uncharacterized protein L969DRAFT_92762 [Mixia osmundae IAM 14324]|uniref:3-hydroxyisobutyrate dehydrogenase n=1 Tax=Mixia osmundae (strain CBS 9802 / IAM 14324 / JCM 22182 / KY 12970) TaxID=764103 RepID=G7DYH2_MIXOS|nr:uncharacterized protein L969DRAFT_92762 [Mixia osmundae IAM 14324]KEI41533.1 hypothetical protein L969DRAFT_92762 [Mixia osmundae IAM 14324]GAA95632.1 hypothetical protein E5Q_02288 [Mixia osmundae IAM 14324]